MHNTNELSLIRVLFYRLAHHLREAQVDALGCCNSRARYELKRATKDLWYAREHAIHYGLLPLATEGMRSGCRAFHATGHTSAIWRRHLNDVHLERLKAAAQARFTRYRKEHPTSLKTDHHTQHGFINHNPCRP